MSARGSWVGWEFTPKGHLLCPRCATAYRKRINSIMEEAEADAFLAKMIPVDPNKHMRYEDHKCYAGKCPNQLSILSAA